MSLSKSRILVLAVPYTLIGTCEPYELRIWPRIRIQCPSEKVAEEISDHASAYVFPEYYDEFNEYIQTIFRSRYRASGYDECRPEAQSFDKDAPSPNDHFRAEKEPDSKRYKLVPLWTEWDNVCTSVERLKLKELELGSQVELDFKHNAMEEGSDGDSDDEEKEATK